MVVLHQDTGRAVPGHFGHCIRARPVEAHGRHPTPRASAGPRRGRRGRSHRWWWQNHQRGVGDHVVGHRGRPRDRARWCGSRQAVVPPEALLHGRCRSASPMATETQVVPLPASRSRRVAARPAPRSHLAPAHASPVGRNRSQLDATTRSSGAATESIRRTLPGPPAIGTRGRTAPGGDPGGDPGDPGALAPPGQRPPRPVRRSARPVARGSGSASGARSATGPPRSWPRSRPPTPLLMPNRLRWGSRTRGCRTRRWSWWRGRNIQSPRRRRCCPRRPPVPEFPETT